MNVMYRDIHRVAVVYHWVALTVRWWKRMSAARTGARENLWLIVLGLRMCRRRWVP